MGLLQSRFEREKEPSLIVFNSLNWKRSGLATVFIDHQIVPRGKTAGIFDKKGNRLAVQPLQHRSDVTEWAVWLEDIPAFGYKKYTVKALDAVVPASETTKILENKWFRIETNPAKGTIISWFDKELQQELIDKNNQYGMGEFILEKLGNRSQMESHKLDDFKRLALDTVWFDSMNKNEIWNSIKFYGESETAEGPRGFMLEIRLFNTDKRLDIACSIIKKSIVSPESFYIAFPFDIEDGKHFTEVQGGVIESGKDQIKGSSNDWYTVQNFTAIRNGNMQLIIGSAAMPLMQLGAINTGRYKAGAMPQSTNLFSWPMNNYWVTNFNADQRGGHSWTYYLTTSNDISNAAATRFGAGCRTPFLTRIIPGSGKGDNNWEGTFISGWPANVLLVSAVPASDGKSCIVHLRETDNHKATLSLTNGITGKALNSLEVDANGREISDPSIEIAPLQSKFFRLFF
jgi:alpha-mannosidase